MSWVAIRAACHVPLRAGRQGVRCVVRLCTLADVPHKRRRCMLCVERFGVRFLSRALPLVSEGAPRYGVVDLGIKRLGVDLHFQRI